MPQHLPPSFARAAFLGLVASFALAGCAIDDDEPAVVTLRAERSESWAARGFTRMTGPLRPPTSRHDRDEIEVWLKLPDGGVIDLSSAPGRRHLALPAGTIIDRVESVGVEGGPTRVDDVRGTLLEADGRQRFHVLRRADDSLVGLSWLRGSATAQSRADASLAEWLEGRGADRREQRRLVELNQCARCHGFDKPVSPVANERGLPNRATDLHGFYQVEGVLLDEAPAETARPRDTNLDDPFIVHRCAAGEPPIRVQDERVTHLRCADGGPPVGRLDVARALAAGDAHAAEVCASRAFLRAHMSAPARQAFSDAFAVCGIPTESVEGVERQ